MRNKILKIFNDEIFRDILKGTGIVFLLRILASIITFLLTLTIVKQLGTEQSGYYFFIISFLMFLSAASSFGLYNAILKEIAININNNVYVSNIITKAILLIVLGSILSSIILLIYNIISIELNLINPIINDYLLFIIISILPFTLTFLFSSYFQATKNSIISMIMLNLGYQSIMLFLLLIYSISTVEELLKIFDISILLMVIFALGIYIFKHKNSFRFTQDKSFSALLSLSMPMMVAHIISQINNFSGQLLLSIYATPSDISLFAVTMRIAILMSFFIMAVNRIVAPQFATLYHLDDMEKLEEIVLFSNKLLLIFSLPMLVIIIIFGHEILSLFGPEFIDAYNILIIVTTGQFVASVSGTVVFLLQMTGSEKIIRNNILVSTILSLLLGLIIVPIYGIVGAAIMTFVSLVTVNLLSCYKTYKILGINPLKFYDIKGAK